ncbi:nuclear transport factor 2 family protein [Brevundimonas sp.]|uniref:nuclear transport factor 2 family protein n=1 Tax=Brevundimonas sp. TaxID=1871086 RepID=UPI002731C6A2|nr:nuclear transport factor 2 family protein [Brevundimonas sp.]MDP1912582.1 nuclear transport factor 2 family protein [Brevundimonas sp.]
MTLRTVLMAALIAASAVGAPMAASAATPPTVRSDAASDAANQAVVESLYRAFAAGDGATIGGLLATDLVWIEAESGPYADRNPYNGPAAVFEGIFGRVGAEFQGFAATPQTFLPSGDRVAVLGRYTGTNRATGEALDAQFVHVFTVTGGKITHFQQYTDTAQWVDVMTPD